MRLQTRLGQLHSAIVVRENAPASLTAPHCRASDQTVTKVLRSPDRLVARWQRRSCQLEMLTTSKVSDEQKSSEPTAARGIGRGPALRSQDSAPLRGRRGR